MDTMQKTKIYLRVEVFTTVSMKNAIFWDVISVALVRNDVLGGMYCLQHQGDKNRRATSNIRSN
jgi:hypothetical protein